MAKQTVTVKIDVDRTELDEALKKIEILKAKMQETKTLADELAACMNGLKLEVELQR